MKIRRRCKCGCGGIVKPGNKYIHGHTWKNKKRSKETVLKMSIAKMGNTNGKGCKGKKKSEEHKLKISISRIKYDPHYEYNGSWQDRSYKKDLRKNYCENKNCKNISNFLNNHHIDLDKKNCHPKNIMTLCASCHATLHNKLQGGKLVAAHSKDFIIINRSDHISYINKEARRIIKLQRIELQDEAS